MILMRWWFRCLMAGLTFVQELLFFLFLLFLSWTLGIQRFHFAFLRGGELGQMSYEKHQLPAVLVFLVRAPGRHSGDPDAVLNGVVKFPIGQVLRQRQPHVWSLWIQVSPDLGIPASVIGMTVGTVVGKMCSTVDH